PLHAVPQVDGVGQAVLADPAVLLARKAYGDVGHQPGGDLHVVAGLIAEQLPGERPVHHRGDGVIGGRGVDVADVVASDVLQRAASPVSGTTGAVVTVARAGGGNERQGRDQSDRSRLSGISRYHAT